MIAVSPAVIQLALPGRVTTISFELPEGITENEWQRIGAALARVKTAHQWWIGDWLRFGECMWGQKYAEALTGELGDYGSLRNAAYVAGRFDLSRRRDKLPFSFHQEVAALPDSEQDEWLDRCEAEGWTRDQLRTALRQYRQADRVAGLATASFPVGQFSIVLADPPWRYEHVATANRAIENQYPTLDLDGIRALSDGSRSVADLAADPALLFLWAPSPKAAEAMQVIEAWGFEYRTSLVWIKDVIGMGYYFRSRHEWLLVARRGDFPAPVETMRPDSVIEAPRRAHSQKPDAIYEMIEQLYPGVRRVELFARTARPGWERWGNEAPKAGAA